VLAGRAGRIAFIDFASPDFAANGTLPVSGALPISVVAGCKALEVGLSSAGDDDSAPFSLTVFSMGAAASRFATTESRVFVPGPCACADWAASKVTTAPSVASMKARLYDLPFT
jgi:hypothetical protein